MKFKNKKNVLLILALIISFYIIERSVGTLSPQSFLANGIKYKRITSLSLIFLGAILLLYLTLFNNVINAILIFFLTAFSFTIANSQKILMRGEPIFPHDLHEIINILDLYKMLGKRQQVVSFLLITVFVFLLIGLNKSAALQDYRVYFVSNRVRFLGLGTSVIILILFLGINSFNTPLSAFLNNSGFQYFPWNPLSTYRENGVVISFISNFPGVSMDKPSDYNIEKMNNISDKYVKIANEINRDRKRDNFEDINVVYILSESLADPSRLSTIELSENALSYIQNKEDKNIAGQLLTPEYGGGTANVEFEVLTSLSTGFLLPNMSLPYQDILAYKNNFPSIAREIKFADRKSIAMHSFHSKFYQRRKVFKNMGFDEMYFDNEFNYTDTLEGANYISDASSYNEILDFISNQNSLFLHFITMQNHTPYQDIYQSYPINVISEIDEGLDLIEIYTEEIRQTDIATRDFIETIDRLENKTIVVLYGDHLPPIYSNHLTEVDDLNKHLTDYFMYSNFTDKKIEVDEFIPTYYLNNLVYELADVKVTPLLAFTEKFNDEISGIIKNHYILKDGSMLTYDELSDKQKELVDDYIIIQYDIIEGNCYFTNICN